jgi:hypothetical protein
LPTAHAQLAQSFYNITAVRTRVLPNAVQVTVQTDGTPQFGGDLDEFLSTENDTFAPKSTAAFRIRFVGARSRLPAFVDVGQYPVDAVAVTPGNAPLPHPWFGDESTEPRAGDASVPRVDLTFRFFVPVRLMQWTYQGPDDGIRFSAELAPRDVQVRLGPDNRSIVITVVADRVTVNREGSRLRRSPAAQHKHRLNIAPAAPDPASGAVRVKVDALHAPLADVLADLSNATAVPLTVQPDAATADVSLYLPAVNLGEVLDALRTGYGLSTLPRPEEQGGGFIVGRSGLATVTERIPLRYLTPDAARLLLPDFLLPSLRVSPEGNALVAAGAPELIARVRADLARLDLPRPLVRVDVKAYEVRRNDDLRHSLAAVYGRPTDVWRLDGSAGTLSVILQKGQKEGLSARLEALRTLGRARLTDTPFVTVAVGSSGSLFAGQTRYIRVLRTVRGVQQAQALRLPIGTTLSVTPSVGTGGEITLNAIARVATVDAIESPSGLPTLGIREVVSTYRVGSGQSALIAGLDSDIVFTDRRHTPFRRLPLIGKPLDWALSPLLGARFDSRERVAFVLLLTARVVETGSGGDYLSPLPPLPSLGEEVPVNARLSATEPYHISPPSPPLPAGDVRPSLGEGEGG